MQIRSIHFKSQASRSLANPTLQANLHKFGIGGLALLRARAVEAYGKDEFEKLRVAGEAIRDRTLAELDGWVERGGAAAPRRGATGLYARDAKEARERLRDSGPRHNDQKAAQSRAMAAAGLGANEARIANGVTAS